MPSRPMHNTGLTPVQNYAFTDVVFMTYVNITETIRAKGLKKGLIPHRDFNIGVTAYIHRYKEDL